MGHLVEVLEVSTGHLVEAVRDDSMGHLVEVLEVSTGHLVEAVRDNSTTVLVGLTGQVVSADHLVKALEASVGHLAEAVRDDSMDRLVKVLVVSTGHLTEAVLADSTRVLVVLAVPGAPARVPLMALRAAFLGTAVAREVLAPGRRAATTWRLSSSRSNPRLSLRLPSTA
jgi:hypothetical protein